MQGQTTFVPFFNTSRLGVLIRQALRLSFIPVALFTTHNAVAADEPQETVVVTASALKVETPLKETPRAVSLIDQEALKVKQPSKLDEALRYQPGVVTQPYGSDNDTDWFKIRSFDAAMYLDNNRLYETGYYVWTLEPYGLQSVEVLKGPAAILYGEAPPGGVVNAVSKRPDDIEFGEAQLKLGNRQQRELGIDINRYVDEDGDMRFRFVGLIGERDGTLDHTDNQRIYLAPSLTIDFSQDTTLTLLASYKQDDGTPTNPFKPAYGTLIDTQNGKIDPSTNLGEPDYDKNENTQFSLAYELEHHINDTWTFKQNTRYAYTDLLLRSTYAFGSETSTDASRGIIFRDGKTHSLSSDNNLIAKWDTARTENVTLFGLELQGFKNDSKEADDWGIAYGGTTGGIDALNPVYGNYTPIDDRATKVDIKKTLAGFYAQHQVTLDEQWIAKFGGRYDIVRLENDTVSASQDIHNDEFSFSGGLMYVAQNGLSPYINYDESFEVLTSVDENGEAYKPLKGKQTEVGVKYEPEFVNGYVNLAWFDITQKNGLVTTGGAYTTQSGELTSQGIEVETKIQATDDLMLTANYTYTDAKTDMTADADPTRTPMIPRHMASAWLEYDLSHLGLTGFVVGAGSRYMGTTTGHNSAGNDTLHVPNVTLFDAMARYDINQKWRAQLNINNLTDKEYVSACDYYCYYGEEMSATATINYMW